MITTNSIKINNKMKSNIKNRLFIDIILGKYPKLIKNYGRETIYGIIIEY